MSRLMKALMKTMTLKLTIACTMALPLLATTLSQSVTATAAENTIIVQSTTSTQNSGLYTYLIPLIKADTGVTLRVIAVGTGQAIRNAQNCDGDVLLVHAKSSELKFVASGYGVTRHDVMYNDFVIVGPPADPANVTALNSAKDALTKIANAKALFASRGDDSGTHKKERTLWSSTGIDPGKFSGKWYRETGSGMGATLNIGVGMGAYVLTDRATWISFANKGDFKVHVQGDPPLNNQYGVIKVNPKKCPNVKSAAADTLITWLLSPKGQATIAAYRVSGKQLFFPNAKK